MTTYTAKDAGCYADSNETLGALNSHCDDSCYWQLVNGRFVLTVSARGHLDRANALRAALAQAE